MNKRPYVICLMMASVDGKILGDKWGNDPHVKALLDSFEETHDSLVKKFRSMRYEGLYTPPDLKGTLQLPGTRGGGEWGGGAFDPATNMFYIKSNDAPDLITIVRGTNQASTEQVTATSQLETVDRHGWTVNSLAFRFQTKVVTLTRHPYGERAK